MKLGFFALGAASVCALHAAQPLVAQAPVVQAPVVQAPATKTPAPLKALLLTGGCCHDYKAQKDILKSGLEKRLNLVVTQIHSDDGGTKPPLPIYGNPDYAKGFDIVIHDECAADVNDQAVVEGVLKPHRDGVPGVNLHCAVHSYRIGNPGDAAQAGTPHSFWFDYLGLQSSGHGPQLPIAIAFLPQTKSPITNGLASWTTGNEELYNNVQVGPNAKPLARGLQENGDKMGENNSLVVWTNEYGDQKTRVFSTTIGHNNQTVGDDRYLDLVARGILWACDKINADGTPQTGYAAPQK